MGNRVVAVDEEFQPFLRFWRRNGGHRGGGLPKRFQPFLRFWLYIRRKIFAPPPPVSVSTLLEILDDLTTLTARAGHRKYGFQPFLRFWIMDEVHHVPARTVRVSTLLEILEEIYWPL